MFNPEVVKASKNKDLVEFKNKLCNMPMANLLSIESRLLLWCKELSDFISWYEVTSVNNNVKFTKKMFTEKALTYDKINGNWMGHMCKTCKKSEIPQAIHRLRIELYFNNISLTYLNEELKNREYKKYNDKLRKEVVAKLLNKLYTSIEKNPNLFSDDEIACISGLIESGTIKTSAELKRYGVY